MARRTRRLGIVAVPLALALGAGAAARAAATYVDPPGDVRGGAGPDLTAITVSHTAATITFRVRFAKAPPLAASAREGWTDMLLVALDTPPRSLKRTAHGWLGADYYVGTHGTQRTAMLVRPPTTSSGRGTVLARTRVSVSGRTLSFTVSRVLLGDPAWVEFVVAAGRETSRGSGGGSDEAPTHGSLRYQLER